MVADVDADVDVGTDGVRMGVRNVTEKRSGSPLMSGKWHKSGQGEEEC